MQRKLLARSHSSKLGKVTSTSGRETFATHVADNVPDERARSKRLQWICHGWSEASCSTHWATKAMISGDLYDMMSHGVFISQKADISIQRSLGHLRSTCATYDYAIVRLLSQQGMAMTARLPTVSNGTPGGTGLAMASCTKLVHRSSTMYNH
jgi:hypothetical protein